MERQKRFSKESPTPAEYPEKSYYVTMTDTFFSGAPHKNDMRNKYVIGTDDFDEAERLKKVAKQRSEMKHVSIATNAPNYDAYVDYRDASEINWD